MLVNSYLWNTLRIATLSLRLSRHQLRISHPAVLLDPGGGAEDRNAGNSWMAGPSPAMTECAASELAAHPSDGVARLLRMRPSHASTALASRFATSSTAVPTSAEASEPASTPSLTALCSASSS